MLNSEKAPQSWLQSHVPSSHEGEEGGLNLGQLGAALRRRSWLIIGMTGLVAAAALLKAEKDPLIYQGKFEVLTRSVSAENQVTANLPQSLNSKNNQQGIAAPEPEQDTKTIIKVLQSPAVLNSVIKDINSQYPDLDYDSLLENLQITSTEKKYSRSTIQF